jgi:hypothetical protein
MDLRQVLAAAVDKQERERAAADRVYTHHDQTLQRLGGYPGGNPWAGIVHRYPEPSPLNTMGQPMRDANGMAFLPTGPGYGEQMPMPQEDIARILSGQSPAQQTPAAPPQQAPAAVTPSYIAPRSHTARIAEIRGNTGINETEYEYVGEGKGMAGWDRARVELPWSAKNRQQAALDRRAAREEQKGEMELYNKGMEQAEVQRKYEADQNLFALKMANMNNKESTMFEKREMDKQLEQRAKKLGVKYELAFPDKTDSATTGGGVESATEFSQRAESPLGKALGINSKSTEANIYDKIGAFEGPLEPYRDELKELIQLGRSARPRGFVADNPTTPEGWAAKEALREENDRVSLQEAMLEAEKKRKQKVRNSIRGRYQWSGR